MSRGPFARHARSRGPAVRATAALAIVIAGAALALALAPPPAFAATGTWPVRSTQVLLAHGEPYALAQETRTHSGADIAASPDEAVQAGMSGEVAFVGRVPAAGGEQVLAVTVQCGDVKLTYLPLSSAEVAKGDSVGGGDTIGRVAGEGDPSSAGTHVHVSARRGTMYADPVALLAAPPLEHAEEEPEPAGGDAGAESPAEAQPAPRPATPAARPAPATAGAPKTAAAPVVAPAPTAAPSAAQAPAAAAGAVSAAAAAVSAPAQQPPEAVVGKAAAASSAIASRAAAGGQALVPLFGIDGTPAIGLRLPGLAECALGIAASLALRVGLGRSSATRRAGVLVPALAEERR